MEQKPYNRNGGLTLVPMPGFEEQAERVKGLIEGMDPAKHYPTAVDIVIPKFGRRANGEPFVQLGKDHIGGHDCVVITSGPGIPDMLINLLLLLGYFFARHAARISIVSGYLPLSRSDKDEGELELALLPHIVHLLDAAAYGKLERIVAADLHSEQAVMAGRMAIVTGVSLIRRVLTKVIKMAETIHPDLKLCLFFTDQGSVKRYEEPVAEICEEMHITLPIVEGRKRRVSSHESRLVGLDGDIGAIREALVLGVDDEMATGGTNNDVAAFIKGHHEAAHYWAVVVHPVLCSRAPHILGDLQSAIDCTFVMGTIPTHNRQELTGLIKNGRLVILPWDDDLANILFYLHWDHTIRTLR